MVVVSDTSPIRALSHLGLVPLLAKLYGEVVIPPAVAGELQRGSLRTPPIDYREFDFIQLRRPSDPRRTANLVQRLDQGEAEALSLALELRAGAVLIDELAGRAVAEELGLVAVGTLGVLLEAKRRLLIPRIREFMDRLVAEIGFFVSDQVRDSVLRAAGEQE